MGEALAAATAILITLGLAGPTPEGQAATKAGRLHVMLLNDNVVPPDVAARARAAVVQIFSQIDVEVVWVTEPFNDGRRVRVVKLTNWEPGDRRLSAALGMTVTGERSRSAYVIWPRVHNLALRSAVGLDAMLAVAIAHEMGHMLVPTRSHAAQGLMRAEWDANDLRSAAAGLLGFSRESAGRIARAMRAEVTVAGR